MSAFAAALILAEYHTMRFNAPCRFPDLQLDCPALDEDDATRQRYWCWNWPKTMLWLAMAVSMPLCSLGYSLATAEAASVPGVFQPNVGWGTGIAGILLGWLCFLPALVLLSYVSARYVHPQARLSGLLPSDQWFIHRRAKHTFYRVA